MTLSSQDINWLAGIFEGEGWFGWDARNHSTKSYIGMTDKDIIDKIQNLLRGAGSRHTRFRPNSRKELYELTISGVDAAGLMMTIYSLMGTRRQEQIRRALE